MAILSFQTFHTEPFSPWRDNRNHKDDPLENEEKPGREYAPSAIASIGSELHWKIHFEVGKGKELESWSDRSDERCPWAVPH